MYSRSWLTLILGFCFLSCQSKEASHWAYCKKAIYTSQPPQQTLSYRNPHSLSPLGFELIKGERGYKALIRLPSDLCLKTQDTTVQIIIDEQVINSNAQYKQAKHHVILPYQAVENIIAALKKKKSVTLIIEDHILKLDAAGFDSRFQTLLKAN